MFGLYSGLYWPSFLLFAKMKLRYVCTSVELSQSINKNTHRDFDSLICVCRWIKYCRKQLQRNNLRTAAAGSGDYAVRIEFKMTFFIMLPNVLGVSKCEGFLSTAAEPQLSPIRFKTLWLLLKVFAFACHILFDSKGCIKNLGSKRFLNNSPSGYAKHIYFVSTATVIQNVWWAYSAYGMFWSCLDFLEETKHCAGFLWPAGVLKIH